MNIDELIQLIVTTADESKGESIEWIDVQNGNFPVQKIVLITAMNNVHLRAMAETISLKAREEIRAAGDAAEMLEPIISGKSESGWIVLDFATLAVHILTLELRNYYELDSFFEKQGVVYHHQ